MRAIDVPPFGPCWPGNGPRPARCQTWPQAGLRPWSLARHVLALWLWGAAAHGQAPIPLCHPVVTEDRIIASAAARQQAGALAVPPIADRKVGFAWPDTPLGIVRTPTGYAFFASDGSRHETPVGPMGGSAVRTLGTLDDPLGRAPPVEAIIAPNPDPAVNPEYRTYTYLGGGPVFRVPPGLPGAGRLLMVTHAEIRTPATRPHPSFYAILGLAASDDGGRSWIALGEIIRVNHPYEQDMDGFDIGDPPLVRTPDGEFLQIYFRDWQGSAPHWGDSVTRASVARAPLAAVAAAAFGGPRRSAAPFRKYFEGAWSEPGIGGRATDIYPHGVGADLQVVYSSELHRYIMMISTGVSVWYAESADGLNWSKPQMLRDFRPMHGHIYIMPAGTGADPADPGRSYVVLYTFYPDNGSGWGGASVGRLSVSCSP
jgi:hypothetical protein